MRLLERLLVNTGERVAAPYLRTFARRNPEIALRNSLELLGPDSANEVKKFVVSCLTESGGFKDRAGKPDLYYTLFGHFISNALDLESLYPGISGFTRDQIRSESLSDVHLHCAAIISSTSPTGWSKQGGLYHIRPGVKESIRRQLKQKKIYNAFLSLLTCYYIKDYFGVYTIRKYLGRMEVLSEMPCTLTAAALVLRKTFNKPQEDLVQRLLSFYDNNGGFRAVKTAKAPDLLSTAVALYALNFADADLRVIRPHCMVYVDSLYHNGGFSANSFDPDTDIEYTFYGLLALGALAV